MLLPKVAKFCRPTRIFNKLSPYWLVLCYGGGTKDQIEAFRALDSQIKHKSHTPLRKFVKKLDEVPQVTIFSQEVRKLTFLLTKRELVGKFTGLWPNLKAIDSWLVENWSPIMKGQVDSYAIGIIFSLFLFYN